MSYRVGGYRALARIDARGPALAGPGAEGLDPHGSAPHGSARWWLGEREHDGERVALKVFPVGGAPSARREAALVRLVGHPHLLAIRDVVDVDDRAVLVADRCAGGSLADLLDRRGPLPPGQAVTVLVPIAAALMACAERDVVHGALTADSIRFAATGRPVLADVGAVVTAIEFGLPTPTGAADAAPELARGAAPTIAGDVFSLGSIGLRCLTGRAAWPAEDLTDVLIQSTAGQWPDLPDDAASPALVALIRDMLEADPAARPSLDEVLQRLHGAEPAQPVDFARAASAAGGTAARAADARDTADAPVDGAHEQSEAGRGDDPARAVGRALQRLRATRSMPADAGTDRPRHQRAAAPKPTRARRVIVGLAGAVLLGGLAVQGGLWWAGWDDPAGATAAAAAELRPAVGSFPSDVAAASPTAEDAAAPPTGSPVDWLVVLRGLERARAEAVSTADPALLAGVYTPDASARRADEELIERMRAGGLRVEGGAHEISEVIVLSPPSADAPALLRVVASLAPYAVRDQSGRVVGETTAAARASRVVSVANTTDGFRIERIEPG